MDRVQCKGSKRLDGSTQGNDTQSDDTMVKLLLSLTTTTNSDSTAKITSTDLVLPDEDDDEDDDNDRHTSDNAGDRVDLCTRGSFHVTLFALMSKGLVSPFLSMQTDSASPAIFLNNAAFAGDERLVKVLLNVLFPVATVSETDMSTRASSNFNDGKELSILNTVALAMALLSAI
jgi:hypothetical protein